MKIQILQGRADGLEKFCKLRGDMVRASQVCRRCLHSFKFNACEILIE